jgi:hypothetical protein
MPEIAMRRPATTVKLTDPIPFAGGTISQVELKEPKGMQLLEIGEPRTPVMSSGGTLYWVENPEIIGRYLEVCVAAPGEAGKAIFGQALFSLLSFQDAREVKQTFVSFLH